MKKSLMTLQFGLLCLSGFLFFSSFNMIVPELPSFLTAMGGGEYKGLIISLFTLTAGLSRPFSGKLADKIGRIPVMVVGALVSAIAALFYPFVTTVIGFFFLRFFHGFSTGFKPTGTSAYVADIVPASRRGEAMGLIGFFSSLGMAAGPALGSYLAKYFSLDIMFYTSSGAAVLSVLILIGMKETLLKKEKLAFEHIIIRKHEILEPLVLIPSVVMFLAVYSFGAVLTVIPDLSDHLLIDNRGLFFTCFTLASLFVRLVAGHASDKYGRVPVLKVGLVLLTASMVLIANVHNEVLFVISAVMFGLGVGICSPTVLAWTVDHCNENHRGRGIATMYIALEAGIGVGALTSGWVYQNDSSRISLVFYIASICSLIGFIFLYSKNVKNLSKKP